MLTIRTIEPLLLVRYTAVFDDKIYHFMHFVFIRKEFESDTVNVTLFLRRQSVVTAVTFTFSR